MISEPFKNPFELGNSYSHLKNIASMTPLRSAPAGAPAVAHKTIRPFLAVNATTSKRSSSVLCLAAAAPEPFSRRAALVASSLLIIPTLSAVAEEDAAPASTLFTDPEDNFTLVVPSGWAQGSGSLGGPDPRDSRSRFSNAAGLQRVVAFYPPSTPDVSIAITVRTPGADFTSLGSFGSVTEWAESLVASMDRSYLLKGAAKVSGRGARDPVTVAKLVNAVESKGRYIVQYSVGQTGAPTRVVVSAVALGTSPKGLRRFFTVNGSCTEEKAGEFAGVLRAAVESFTPPPYLV